MNRTIKSQLSPSEISQHIPKHVFFPHDELGEGMFLC